jgi:hypothetical protein
LLAVSAVLFLAWIGWLAYLAATTTRPTVLARPQFLVADLYVIAQVDADPQAPDQPAEMVTVKKVVWSKEPGDTKRTQILVKNLSKVNAEHGWEGPGEYVLALSHAREGPDLFQVTPLPRTPGFSGAAGRIYPAKHETLEQLEQLKAEYHP